MACGCGVSPSCGYSAGVMGGFFGLPTGLLVGFDVSIYASFSQFINNFLYFSQSNVGWFGRSCPIATPLRWGWGIRVDVIDLDGGICNPIVINMIKSNIIQIATASKSLFVTFHHNRTFVIFMISFMSRWQNLFVPFDF